MPGKRLVLLATSLSAAIAAGLSAQGTSPSIQAAGVHAEAFPADPSSLLGLTPAQALDRFGPPDRVFAVRGREPWQDDVVFSYDEGYELFLFKDRVWQVGVGQGYRGPVLGFTLGTAWERAAAIFGAPATLPDGSREWELRGSAWPVRVRGAVDSTGAITELFFYRADF